MSKNNLDSLHLLDVTFCIPPGATLEEEIDALGITQKELAKRTGLTVQTINRIIKGNTPITPETAQKLAYVTNTSANFWLSLEMNYRDALKQQCLSDDAIQKAAKEFTDAFPYKELVARGVCKNTSNPAEQKEALLRFFAVSGEEQYRSTYEENLVGAARVGYSQKWDSAAFASWLRLGEIAALQMDTCAFSSEKLRDAIQETRKIINDTPETVWKEIQFILSQAGVAAVVVPELKQTHVSGFSRFITSDKAILQLSLRGARVGTFWFNLYHELCHLLKHGKKKVFINASEALAGKHAESKQDEEEIEANNFSRDTLIPAVDWKFFIRKRDFSIETIRNFAQYIHVPVDVIIGRLKMERRIQYYELTNYHQNIDVTSFEIPQLAISIEPACI